MANFRKAIAQRGVGPFGGDATYDDMSSVVGESVLTRQFAPESSPAVQDAATPEPAVIPQFPKIDINLVLRNRTRMARALSISTLNLLNEIIAIDREFSRSRKDSPWFASVPDKNKAPVPRLDFEIMHMMLTVTDTDVLEACIWGTIFSNKEILRKLPTETPSPITWSGTPPDVTNRPLEYIQTVADKDGKNLTGNELARVIEKVELYAKTSSEFLDLQNEYDKASRGSMFAVALPKLPPAAFDTASQAYATLVEAVHPAINDPIGKLRQGPDYRDRGGRRYIPTQTKYDNISHWVRVAKSQLTLIPTTVSSKPRLRSTC